MDTDAVLAKTNHEDEMEDRKTITAKLPALQNKTIYGVDWVVEGGDKTMLVKSFGEVIEGTCREIQN